MSLTTNEKPSMTTPIVQVFESVIRKLERISNYHGELQKIYATETDLFASREAFVELTEWEEKNLPLIRFVERTLYNIGSVLTSINIPEEEANQTMKTDAEHSVSAQHTQETEISQPSTSVDTKKPLFSDIINTLINKGKDTKNNYDFTDFLRNMFSDDFLDVVYVENLTNDLEGLKCFVFGAISLLTEQEQIIEKLETLALVAEIDHK